MGMKPEQTPRTVARGRRPWTNLAGACVLLTGMLTACSNNQQAVVTPTTAQAPTTAALVETTPAGTALPAETVTVGPEATAAETATVGMETTTEATTTTDGTGGDTTGGTSGGTTTGAVTQSFVTVAEVASSQTGMENQTVSLRDEVVRVIGTNAFVLRENVPMSGGSTNGTGTTDGATTADETATTMADETATAGTDETATTGALDETATTSAETATPEGMATTQGTELLVIYVGATGTTGTGTGALDETATATTADETATADVTATADETATTGSADETATPGIDETATATVDETAAADTTATVEATTTTDGGTSTGGISSISVDLQGEIIEITGTIRTLVAADIESEFNIQLDDETISQFENQPVVIATMVQRAEQGTTAQPSSQLQEQFGSVITVAEIVSNAEQFEGQQVVVEQVAESINGQVQAFLFREGGMASADSGTLTATPTIEETTTATLDETATAGMDETATTGAETTMGGVTAPGAMGSGSVLLVILGQQGTTGGAMADETATAGSADETATAGAADETATATDETATAMADETATTGTMDETATAGAETATPADGTTGGATFTANQFEGLVRVTGTIRRLTADDLESQLGLTGITLSEQDMQMLQNGALVLVADSVESVR